MHIIIDPLLALWRTDYWHITDTTPKKKVKSIGLRSLPEVIIYQVHIMYILSHAHIQTENKYVFVCTHHKTLSLAYYSVEIYQYIW